jgi:hypothetical protein
MEEVLRLQAEPVEMEQYRCTIESGSSVLHLCEP